MKNEDLLVLIIGMLTMLVVVIIARFIKDLLNKGKHVPKYILITSITGLMMVCGLISGIVYKDNIAIIFILTTGLGISGLIASLLIMLAVYKRK